MIKHVLFDCDGVLVDTEIVAARVMVEALNESGVDLTLDYYLNNLTGSTFSTIINTYMGESFNGHSRKEFLEELENKTIEKVEPIKGVELVLKALELPKSIVSNSAVWYVKHVTEKTGIDHYFTGHIFSSELVAHPKPSPDVYNLALSELKLLPAEMVAVEDSVTGVRSAIASGIPVIGFTGASHIVSGHADKLKKLGVLDIASDMEELNYILGNLLKN